ncbi:MAG: hypothetical protein CL912_09060 [Deltaproteobacteria bacterium]|nr:hypothetical protein [Deltaproteobacteria bacterium]
MASKWEVMDVEVTVKHHSTVTTHKENCRCNHRAVNLFSNHCDVELQDEEPSSPFSLSYRHFPGRYHQVPSCQLKPPMTPSRRSVPAQRLGKEFQWMQSHPRHGTTLL